tara:strand:- start:1063 stop:1455 length:393 start_codon:yes stop_codon:yes gene_type:complete
MPVVTGDGARRVGSMANTVGTMYQPNAYCYKVVVEDASNTAIDLRAEDDATDEAVEAIIKELNPLAYFIVNDASGTIHLVMDANHSSASDLQARIRTIGIDDGATTTSIGPNDIDISGTDVTAASSITVA